MSEFAEAILIRIGFASVFLSGAAVIAYGMLHALRCQSPFVHRTVWCLVLAQSLMVFQLPVSIPWKSEGLNHQVFLGADVVSQTTDSIEGRSIQPIAIEPQFSESSKWLPFERLPLAFLVAWIVGIVVVLGRWFTRYVWFVRYLPCRTCDESSWNQEWEELMAERGLVVRIPLCISERVGPLLCRWPDGQRVIVPESLWAKLPREQRQAILRHELAHHERHDLLKTLVANLIAAAHWFNPLAWFAARRYEDSIEWTCDQIVQASKPEAKIHYAKALLALGNHTPMPLTLGSAVFGGGLATRIRRIVSSNNGSDSLLKVLMTLGVLLGFSMVHLVRVELVAEETTVPTKNIISADYFIATVETDLQKELRGINSKGGDSVSIYASVHGRSFFDRERPSLDMSRFDFDSFLRDLASVQKASKVAVTEIRISIEFDNFDEKSVQDLSSKVETAFQRKTKEAGIENVKINKIFINDQREWRRLGVDLESNLQEPKLGDERIGVFAVKTSFSRNLLRSSFFPGGADCLIHLKVVLPFQSEGAFTLQDREVIRKAVSELSMPKGSSVLLMVHFENPRNGREIQEQFPQIRKDSEFQRGAANFLKSLGFARVGTHVDISSVSFLNVHD